VAWPQNHSDGFYWFGIKTGGNGFYWFGFKTCCDGFTGLTSKPVATVSSGLTSKPMVDFLVEPQNQVAGGFPGLGLKTGSYVFADLGLKITATVFWFGPQNQACFGLSVAPQIRRREVSVGHTSKSSSLFSVKQVWLRFPSLP
jgi:hypothetical protein